MIKYTTMIGEFYDANKYKNKDDAVVVLHMLNPEDYIEVKDIYNRQQSIKVKTVLKVGEEDMMEEKHKSQLNEEFDFQLFDKEGKVIDPVKHRDLYLISKNQSGVPLPGEPDVNYDDELTQAAFSPTQHKEYDFEIRDQNGNYVDPKKHPELYIQKKMEDEMF
ncbi:MAG: hypothetical protein HDS11_04115 [Bacteroides sp.]|nr:hypothetical protein [Bacteroides sp.]